MLLTVRYIGPDAAILAGIYILTGETRQVTPAQLADAEDAHPDAFEIVGGERPAHLVALNEPAPTPALPSLNEPAPAAREAQRPTTVRRGRH